jgi:RES domain
LSYPPPTAPVDPLFFSLDQETILVRIYKMRYGSALDFNHFGSDGRFDHHEAKRQPNNQRGVYYISPVTDSTSEDDQIKALDSCIAEIAGGTKIIDNKAEVRKVCWVNANRPLKLLDLRDDGASRVGAYNEISPDPDRNKTQAWSRYFHQTYADIDGIIYTSARIRVDAIMLYERAETCLDLQDDVYMSDPGLYPLIVQLAQERGIIIIS